MRVPHCLQKRASSSFAVRQMGHLARSSGTQHSPLLELARTLPVGKVGE